MNRQELLSKIVQLHTKYKDSIFDDDFLNFPGNEQLKHEFNKNKIAKEKWHQLTRFALSDPIERKYLYDRLLRLVLQYQSYNQYFQVKTEVGTYYNMPDRQADFNRLRILFEEFFDIYRSIINRIHFDYPLETKPSSLIHGKINWDKTIRNSTTKFPLKFEVSYWEREFITPGNILLCLATIWLNRESERLSKTKYDEPLKEEEKIILNVVYEKTKQIIETFPYQQVFAMARKFSRFPQDDKRILDLESKLEQRIREGIVRNKKYLELLHWIKKFRELNIRIVSKSTTNFPIDTLQNLDTIYEAWLFFEMLEYFNEKKLVSSKDLKNKKFEINFSGEKLTVYYEKYYSQKENHAWVIDSWPDFSIEHKKKIIAVFDAKNYGKSSGNKGEATHKMLGYMMNLDVDYGALFFPNFQDNEFSHTRKLLNNTELSLKFAHYKMTPQDSEEFIKEKKQVFDRIFDEIIKRIPITVKQ